jgi:predicted Kef-type K+ transport protein
MNVEIGTEAAQFTGKEYINGIFLAVYVMDSKQEYKIIKQESFFLRQMFSILFFFDYLLELIVAPTFKDLFTIYKDDIRQNSASIKFQ